MCEGALIMRMGLSENRFDFRFNAAMGKTTEAYLVGNDCNHAVPISFCEGKRRCSAHRPARMP